MDSGSIRYMNSDGGMSGRMVDTIEQVARLCL